MIRIQKLVKLRGKGNTVLREQYLRDDIPCQSPLCTTCITEIASESCRKEVLLHKDLSHYIVLAYDTVLKFFEVFETPEIKGIIILQSIALKILQSIGRSRYKSLVAVSKDIRKSCIIFLNEICVHTSVERSPSQSEEEWLACSTWRVAEYYDKHLNSALPIFLVSEQKELFKPFDHNSNVKLVSVEEYLQTMWPELKCAQDLYESISVASTLTSVEDSSKSFDSHLPVDVLESGVKSGRFLRGIIHVNKYISSQEAYVSPSRSDFKYAEDILIVGMRDRNRAIHGDDVAVELLPRSEWKSRCQNLVSGNENIQENNDGSKTSATVPTGRVVGVLDRRWRDYVATFPEETEESAKSSRSGSERVLVWPYDYRIPKIRIATKQADPLRNQRIVVRIDNWEKDSQYPNGHFVRTLGEIGVLETEIQSLLVEHGISVSPFPSSLMPELPSCTDSNPWLVDDQEVQRRKDLRSTHLVYSIDPRGCEDVDDALSVRRLEDGNLELGVHIADVTYFVKQSSLTDLEARSKSTSVYLPDRRYDMLPHVLSGNVCSLLGNVDRYAVSVLWTLDSDYEVQSVWYGRTVIRSAYKLCYEDAQDIILGHTVDEMKEKVKELKNLEGQTLHERFSTLKDTLSMLLDISRALRTKRLAAGGLELNTINMKFEIDESLPSVVQDFRRVEELEIHKTVAECMIFANHWVAKQIATVFPQQAVLRHHPHPREHYLMELQKLAAAKGYDIRIDSNKELASSLENAVDPNNPVVNQIFRIMATRAMNEATYICSGCYALEDFYHYGLGINYYTHFTSPIRRYADVMVHRLLLASVEEKSENGVMKMADIEFICHHMNEKHRAARDMEKNAQELFLAYYFSNGTLENDDGDCLVDAIVYSTKANGLLIYIPQYGMKGAVCLCDKDKKVAVVKDSVSWTDGSLEVQDIELTVKTADGISQKYSLFDVISVRIKVQKPKAHQPKLNFEIAKKVPHQLIGGTVTKLPADSVNKHLTRNDVCNISRPSSTDPSCRPEDTDRGLYDVLECMRRLTLQLPVGFAPLNS